MNVERGRMISGVSAQVSLQTDSPHSSLTDDLGRENRTGSLLTHFPWLVDMPVALRHSHYNSVSLTLDLSSKGII